MTKNIRPTDMRRKDPMTGGGDPGGPYILF